jgi:hypothetical protein
MKIDRPHNQQHYSEPMPRLGKKKRHKPKNTMVVLEVDGGIGGSDGRLNNQEGGKPMLENIVEVALILKGFNFGSTP